MENASKALIIAGAILLSILIISLGIGIFQKAKGATDTAQLDTAQSFNAPFEEYLGTNVSGSQVKALMQEVISHNRKNSDSSLHITIRNSGTAAIGSGTGVLASGAETNLVNAMQTVRANIATGRSYTVAAEYNANTGYVSVITIKAN